MSFPSRSTILYVDDEPENLEVFDINFRHEYNVLLSTTIREAYHFLNNAPIEVIIVDYKMPEENGVDFLQNISLQYNDVVRIMLTAYDQSNIIINSINKGKIFGFVTKPWDRDELNTLIKSGVETFRLRKHNKELLTSVQESNSQLKDALTEIKKLKNMLEIENRYLKSEINSANNPHVIVGKSTPIIKLNSQVELVAKVSTNVLILGETGTGKELVARAIHHKSDRSNKPFVKLNCAALPSTLVESELFGYEKGGFTGAVQSKQGLFEIAHEGTIFLDEIGEVPLDVQPKLLRAIQDREFYRVGGVKPIQVDVRIVAATNRSLTQMIQSGKFRSDLYYRLNVYPIKVPSLKDRKDDIPELVKHFVSIFERKLGISVKEIPTNTLNRILSYHWPGNIRELESYIERLIIENSDSGILNSKYIDWDWDEEINPMDNNELVNIDELEKRQILSALQKANWRVSGENGAAALLHINRNTLRSKMLKYGIGRDAD